MVRQCDFGIEEEYLLVDRASGQVLARPTPAVGRICREVMGEYFAEEMFRSQIEIASPVFGNIHQAREFFTASRQRLSIALAEENAGLYCAASHPSALWVRQSPRPLAHFRQIFDDYQHVARRSLLCGLHVHVGVPQGCDRIQLINRVLYWTPLLLLLSTSSPLWGGQVTGYMSYRRVICSEWPHMGLPEPLTDWGAYQRYRALLQRTGSLAKEGALWWAIRPSHRFPTVELRMTDACPRLEDTLCIAALFRHLVEHCVVPHHDVQPVNREIRWITHENYWRALRYGRQGEFIGSHDEQPVSALGWLAQAEARFPCDTVDAERAFLQARRILAEGTSADRQLAALARARANGLEHRHAMREVVEQVMEDAHNVVPTGPGVTGVTF
ncbi:Putative glutamate--cysteine ligase 2 [Pseudomonas fluorescens]|uniref:carboxylate-amine ligase n=1 Tax=Pseudomonas fluorescens TaxID=294 RepID=UPI001254A1BC|nr:carboxylate-amine ligase [Pseudomonas fluorescens]CAG8863494.1 Putative glutamate--cysteine ligase 2 [Pseudomonas fluorescens]